MERSLVSIELKDYVPEFNPETGKYEDKAPWRWGTTAHSTYKCFCNGYILENRAKFNAHCKGKGHQKALENYQNKTEDVEKRDMRVELEMLKREKQQIEREKRILERTIVELKEKVVSVKRENTKLEEENLALYRELHPSEDEFEDAEED